MTILDRDTGNQDTSPEKLMISASSVRKTAGSWSPTRQSRKPSASSLGQEEPELSAEFV
jgi:hypothetical protein